MRWVVGADEVSGHPVVLVELGPEDLSVLRAGQPVRVEVAEVLRAWRPVLDGEPWSVGVAVTLTEAARKLVVLVLSEEQTAALESAMCWVSAPADGVIDLSPGGAGDVAGPGDVDSELVAVLWAQLAAAVDLAELAAPEPGLGFCGCLCPLHRADGMFCEGDAVVAVVLTPTVSVPEPRSVPMCTPCSGWWRSNRPGRVIAVNNS